MQFLMEKRYILALLLLATVASGQGYLDSLRVLKIDQCLIDQANNAISDLKNSLHQNMQCGDQMWGLGGSWGQWGGNLRGSRLLEERNEEQRQFRGAHGSGRYSFIQPSFSCRDQRQMPGIYSDLYKKVLRVSELLNKVKSYILQYNNILVGSNNAVTGSSNVVIGSRNSLTGSNDWVFASDYQSKDPQVGVLIIENYLIELNEIFKISYNPREVIHCLKKQDSNAHFRGFWNGCKDRHRTSF